MPVMRATVRTTATAVGGMIRQRLRRTRTEQPQHQSTGKDDAISLRLDLNQSPVEKPEHHSSP